ncbi:MAG TPA: class IV adenylate cyclase [Ignavibacteria bacterium]|nr:class IV adenylate cyclase [Ignavibacteria bacterium]HMR41050.1 class IV adenylate cyclase [Ignavibacteria bacterium]
MNKNLEIKTGLENASQINSIRKSLTNYTRSVEKQTDIYYKVEKGRLKLRIIDDKEGNLILYDRAEKKGKRISHYTISRTKDFRELDYILTRQFGVLIKVFKKREIYILKNVRVHLDKVSGLGNFLEIEIIYGDLLKAKKQMSHLTDLLNLDETKFIKNSYSDLLK